MVSVIIGGKRCNQVKLRLKNGTLLQIMRLNITKLLTVYKLHSVIIKKKKQKKRFTIFIGTNIQRNLFLVSPFSVNPNSLCEINKTSLLAFASITRFRCNRLIARASLLAQTLDHRQKKSHTFYVRTL